MKQGPGRPPPGKRKPSRPAPLPERLAQTRKVEQLSRDTGIPRGWAQQVVDGKTTLNEVLTRMARQDRVAQLERRHGLDRSLAAQVADGQVKLDDVLLLQRRSAHLAEHRQRSILVEAAADGQALTLLLHGQKQVTGRILQVDAYEFQLQEAAEAAPLTVHKLQVKLAWPAALAAAVGAAPEGRSVQEPIVRPQDRLHLSDRRLFGLLDAGTRVRVATIEGDQVAGAVRWISRWEFGMALADKAQAPQQLLSVFRHALARVEEV